MSLIDVRLDGDEGGDHTLGVVECVGGFVESVDYEEGNAGADDARGDGCHDGLGFPACLDDGCASTVFVDGVWWVLDTG